MQSEKRLKILFLPAWYPSEVNPIAGTFVKEHAKAASLYNDIVVLYAYDDPSPQPKGLYRVSEEVEEGIRTIRVRWGGILLYLWGKLANKGQREETSSGSGGKPIPILSKLVRIPKRIISHLLYYWSVFAAFRRLVKEGWRPDIIHAHVFTAGVPAVILGKLYRIPVVITEHYIYFPPRILSFWDRVKARFSMNRAQIILPPTNAYKEAIENYGIKNKFQVVPNVVNIKKFYPSLSEKGRRRKRLLFGGNLVPKKGIPFLLEALCQLKEQRHDFILDIVGDGPNRSEYEELAQKLGLTEIVNFHGVKQKDEMAEFMRNCDFFVMPSLYEGFGVVYIEAMACGKPVIATNARGPDEIVNKEAGILVPPKDVKALREAIEYMLDNYQNYSSKKIAQYARERFSYETIGEMLSEVYQTVLSKGKSTKKYEPERYWQERLSKNFSLGGAGHSGLGLEYNKWLYKARIRALNKLLKDGQINPHGKQILDIGCGTGFYIDYWEKLGAAEIVGLDITETSISRLTANYPKYKFIKADITANGLELKGEFDIITAFDVLFHIVDEDKLEQAIANIRGLSHNGTKILIMDSFLTEPRPPGFHENDRSFERYQQVLRENAIGMVRLIPIFYFMNTPIDLAVMRSRFTRVTLSYVWSITKRLLSLGNGLGLPGRLMNYLLGGCLYLVDGIILRYVTDSPGTKLLLAQLGEQQNGKVQSG